MQKKVLRLCVLNTLLAVSLLALTACNPEQSPQPEAPSRTEIAATPTGDVPVSPDETETPSIPNNDLDPEASSTPRKGWPVYVLETSFPESPAQVRLYRQAYPNELKNDARLAEIMAELGITGTISTQVSEGGENEMVITAETGTFRLITDAPFNLIYFADTGFEGNSATGEILSPEIRARKAEEFLNAHSLLDFPYLIEPPQLSRERDRAIRIVPLIDEYPLHDYDPLNGRLLVTFDPAGEISAVFWRPLKLIGGDLVDILPADLAWNQLLKGETPAWSIDHCWQAIVFDPDEEYGVASPIEYPACVSHGSGPVRAYSSASIDDVRLVYFAIDLSLGMSPLAYPADSPARTVFPMWQFSGTTDDGRELIVLWPALSEQ